MLSLGGSAIIAAERANALSKVANLNSLSVAQEQLKRWKRGWFSE